MNRFVFSYSVIIVASLCINYVSAFIIEYGVQQISSKGEDTYCIDPKFNGHSDEEFFALFDGHGGKEVATTASQTIEEHFKSALNNNSSVDEAFCDACKTFDRCICNNPMVLQKSIGSTALMCYCEGDQLHLANLGDCRAVISEKGSPHQLTCDHKPNDEKEKERIHKAGGVVCNVQGTWRVDGMLATSRALGDCFFKDFKTNQHHVDNTPEVTHFHVDPKNSPFLIIASDGLWDAISNEEAIKIVSDLFYYGCTSFKAAQGLAETGSYMRKEKKLNSDDITVMVIHFVEEEDNSNKIKIETSEESDLSDKRLLTCDEPKSVA